jgi:hypothetical protein
MSVLCLAGSLGAWPIGLAGWARPFGAIAIALAQAYAQQPRTFVSPNGSDSNPCTLTSPCRTFQAAIVQTNSGGEIAVLGTAGYNSGATFNIDRPISIVNPGGFEAGIVVPSGGTGITFTATGAFYLRGLTIEGGGTGQNGIVFTTSGFLSIQNCVVRNLTVNGIVFQPDASSNEFLTVSDTYVADNGGFGINVFPGFSNTTTAVFNRVEVDNNGAGGIFVDGGGTTELNATAMDSVVAGNGSAGFSAVTSSGPTKLTVFRSAVIGNNIGLQADGTGAFIRVGQSTVNGNANGWEVMSGGAVQSYLNNQIDGNDTNESAPPSIGSK